MDIAIGSDHGGFELKKKLTSFLKKKGHNIKDFGTYTKDSCDYPKFSYAVAASVREGNFNRGILICKSGIGSSIVANKVPGVRAAVCNSVEAARLSREHNDANVLVFGSKFVSADRARKISMVWLTTEHLGGRHKRRVDQIKDIEKRTTKTQN